MANKVSINVLKKIIKENAIKEKHYTVNIDDKPIEIIVSPYLTAEQLMILLLDV